MLKVLFIGGYGRSGSTLLDRVLGQVEGLWSAGELRHVLAEGYVENRLCGCGAPFAECSFWRQVTSEAFGDPDGFDAAGLLAVQRRVDRWWRIPQLASGVASRRRRAELTRYRDALGRLYLAIRSVSGCEVIVDSSKDVSHGYVLRGIRALDVRILHLVRDSRAVAHSWQRRKFNPGSGADMDRYGPIRTSAEWTAINALTALHRRLGAPYARLAYDELTADPRAAIAKVLRWLGEDRRAVPVAPDGTVDLAPTHTAAGNPMRFASGETRIRPDLEWRRRMPAASRMAVTALTLPSLHRYRDD